MHEPTLKRLQRVNDRRLYSNLCGQFRRELPLLAARSAATGLAALIDGLWLRGALSDGPFNTAQARRLAYQYVDLRLAIANEIGK
jgi:TetR/AcrR family transcriptional repressor of bet genes